MNDLILTIVSCIAPDPPHLQDGMICNLGIDIRDRLSIEVSRTSSSFLRLYYTLCVGFQIESQISDATTAR